MIKESVHQENITVVIMYYAGNIRVLKNVSTNNSEEENIQQWSNKRGLQDPLFQHWTDDTDYQWETLELSHTLDQMDLTDIYIVFISSRTHSSQVHVEHSSGWSCVTLKASLKKFKKIEII